MPTFVASLADAVVVTLGPRDARFPTQLVEAISGMRETTASVVSSSAATDAAFCRAERTTFVGSITPAATKSSYRSVSALKPSSPFISFTRCTTIDAS